MTAPDSRADILVALKAVQTEVSTTISQLSATQFLAQTGNNWSAAGYLKHLILSVKPFARALELSPEQFAKLFGQIEGLSRTYEEVVAFYQAKLANGLRAEQVPNFVPTHYKLPEDINDDNLQVYLRDTWNQANERLITNLENWTEADLDAYQLPHPAIAILTVREMCYFTIYHNRLHARDIAEARLI